MITILRYTSGLSAFLGLGFFFGSLILMGVGAITETGRTFLEPIFMPVGLIGAGGLLVWVIITMARALFRPGPLHDDCDGSDRGYGLWTSEPD